MTKSQKLPLLQECNEEVKNEGKIPSLNTKSLKKTLVLELEEETSKK